MKRLGAARIGGLVAVVAASAVVGCQKIANEKADYGPEVSKASINAALAVAMSGIDANAARAGQAVAYLTTRRLGESETESTLGAATMAAVEDPDADGRLKLVIDTTARADGQMKTTRSERSVAIGLVAAKVAASAEDAPVVATPAPRVTYHRLRTASETLTAPSAIRAAPGCRGLAKCAFDVRYVVFDVVARAANGATERVSVTLGFSPQTPYLPFGDGFDRFNGALVVDCRASTVTVEGRAIAVRDCRRLIDFQK